MPTPANLLVATEAVVIDATTQPGYAGVPVINIDGGSAGSSAAGLRITTSLTSGTTIVRGLAITKFSGPGIEVAAQGNASGSWTTSIEKCYLGMTPAGLSGYGNQYGILINNSPKNRIGVTSGGGNLISGNTWSGVRITGSNAKNNLLQANSIGTDIFGTASRGNGTYGVHLDGAPDNTIGGATAGAGNLISGNGSAGVWVQGAAAQRNFIQGNFIGTNRAGTAALANRFGGVVLSNGPAQNVVGGDTSAAGNLISGNGWSGVEFSSSDSNAVKSNFIGTNAAGTAALANLGEGVSLLASEWCNVWNNLISGNLNSGVTISGTAAQHNTVTQNVIGLSLSGALLGNGLDGVSIDKAANNAIGSGSSPNLISGNGRHGVSISGAAASGNTVQRNAIGLDTSGTAARRNRGSGVYIEDAPNNTVGGVANLVGNFIAGNSDAGVTIVGAGASGNVVQGNFIGTNKTGTASVPNEDGIAITGAPNTVVGGPGGYGNLLSGNTCAGLRIEGAGATGTLVRANFIGTDKNGTADVGNGLQGIFLYESRNTTVGGTTPAEGNLISGNDASGVEISGSGATHNVILGNYIGTDFSGSADLGNKSSGIFLDGAPGNTIGGSASGAANVISGNGGSGIYARGAATGNTILGNVIGTDSSGTVALGNAYSGILLDGVASNSIGGPSAGMGNLISGNGWNGVTLRGSGATGMVVQGNFIGTDRSGSAELGNGGDGIALSGASSNTIGGTQTEASNLISGNKQNGIYLSGSDTTGNLILGNRIGTNREGTAALGNTWAGIFLEGAGGNTIGGTSPDARNLISGNDLMGIALEGGAAGNAIQGNLIGTTMSGTAPLGNAGAGVSLWVAPDNSIGGSDAGAGNVISGNGGSGVYISGLGSEGSRIQGNSIGTDVTGRIDLGNAIHGVHLDGATGILVGGATELTRNVISGNEQSGVVIAGTGAFENLVQGNRIGTDRDGSAALGNSQYGIWLDGAPDNTLGSNLVSANRRDGIYLSGGATRNLISSNYVGTDVSGTADLGNSGCGIFLLGAVANTMGDNLVSGNGGPGIALTGGSENTIAGNFVGTDVTGTLDLGNSGAGVFVAGGSSGNHIGGPAGAGNVISGNDNVGVLVWGGGTTGNLIQGNHIGTDVTGTIRLSNFSTGIFLDGAPGNTIGGVDAGNLISGNNTNGIEVTGSLARGNLIVGNRIGTDVTGVLPLNNGWNGIQITGAPNTVIAGDTDNLIAYNGDAGIRVSSGTGTQIVGNSIHSNTNLGIDLGPGGMTPNDSLDLDMGANDLQNYPELLSASSTAVTGRLNSTPDRTFLLQFYANPAGDSSGYGEGHVFLGTATVTTDADGNATFSASLDASPGPHEIVTATATDLVTLNTSEFSAGVAANDVPLGTPDAFTVDQATTLTVPRAGVLANDDDADGDALSAMLLSDPAHALAFALLADGSFTYTPAPEFWGTDCFVYAPSDGSAFGAPVTVTLTVSYVLSAKLFVAAQEQNSTWVRVCQAPNWTEDFRLEAFPNKKWGVRVATADVNGDGIPDILGVPARGDSGLVQVVDGRTRTQLMGPLGQFQAFPKGGLWVAAADVNRDGRADIIVGGNQGGPLIKIVDGCTGQLLSKFRPFAGAQGNVRVAAADVDGDGHADVVAATAAGTSARIRVFSGQALSTGQVTRLGNFAPYGLYTGGVYVTAVDTNGDGRAEVITRRATGANQLARVFDGFTGAKLGDTDRFLTYNVILGLTGATEAALRDLFR